MNASASNSLEADLDGLTSEAAEELMRHLQALAAAALVDTDVDALLCDLLHRVRDVLQVDSLAVLLSSEDSQKPAMRASIGLDAETENAARATLGVPLLLEGRVLGALQIGTGQSRHFTQGDMLLLQLTANRMARVIEHAAERTARAVAEAAQKRSAFLADTRALLDGSLDLERALESVTRHAVPTLADWCIIEVPGADQAQPIFAIAHADPRDVEGADDLKRRYAAARVELPASSVVAVPLQARGRALGTMTLILSPARGRFGPAADIDFAREVAHRVAMAVDNARLYQETQRAVSVRDLFLASASHDLRTPLSHIKGFLSTLMQRDVEWDVVSRHEFLLEAERATDRLDKLIGDLLDMSRIESGGLDSGTRVTTDPAALVAGGLLRVRRLLHQRRLDLDVPVGLPPVPVDVTQIERVIGNLVENATKYSPRAGIIRVAVTGRDGVIELSVEDDGPGIPTDQLDEIFEKFHRAQTAAHSGVSGTGLGLAISRGIVRAHNGRIWAENRINGGARFVVQLPLAPDATSVGTEDMQ